MIITTTKTLCDVTGKEVPTKVVVAPIHASMFGATEYVNQRFDLSHDGAIKTIERLLVYANRCGEDTPKVVGRVLNNLREKVTAGQTQPYYHQVTTEPLNGSEPIEWQFSRSAYEKKIDATRKQAARECANLAVDVLCKGTPPSNPAQTVYDAITKAFGL